MDNVSDSDDFDGSNCTSFLSSSTVLIVPTIIQQKTMWCIPQLNFIFHEDISPNRLPQLLEHNSFHIPAYSLVAEYEISYR